MKGSAADRLRRLRWLLTWLFTGLNAAGLVVFAWLAVSADLQQREVQLDAELARVTAPVKRLIMGEGDTITTTYVGQDEVNRQCPQFVILPSGAGAFPPYASGRTCVAVDAKRLQTFADLSARNGAVLNGYSSGTAGEMVRVGVEPFRNRNNQEAGAIVAVADARDALAAHDQLKLLVIGGCVLLLGAIGVTGHVLSGRAIRPATTALQQQEVLLAETAHDLRTPVAALRALAEAALRNPAESDELLPRTVRLAARMGGIIDGLLVRARLAAGVESLAIQPVRLDQLVASVVAETPAEGAQVTLVAAPSTVSADPTLVQRAVANLLDNALRYGRRPGYEAVVHVTVAGGQVTVADSGPGIDSSVAEEKFDRFTSGGGSSGLGLSIVRWVALAHGGRLRVYNAEEGGAIFELKLPEAP
ncbi:sensor histidine kinase [Amycolatopsis sp. NPDC102389]|uniref:sensor histidine kinase n=1 Tax=Amycolatopsis sp. NPDC102389 TaxID=3363941 RepID=UPI0038096F89